MITLKGQSICSTECLDIETYIKPHYPLIFLQIEYGYSGIDEYPLETQQLMDLLKISIEEEDQGGVYYFVGNDTWAKGFLTHLLEHIQNYEMGGEDLEIDYRPNAMDFILELCKQYLEQTGDNSIRDLFNLTIDKFFEMFDKVGEEEGWGLDFINGELKSYYQKWVD